MTVAERVERGSSAAFGGDPVNGSSSTTPPDSSLWGWLSSYLYTPAETSRSVSMQASMLVLDDSAYQQEVTHLAKEVDHFVKTVSSFGAMKVTLEYICKDIKVTNGLYSSALRNVPLDLQSSLTTEAELNRFYEAFCKSLEDPSLQISYSKKIVAKISFYLVQKVLFYLLDRFKSDLQKDVIEFFRSREANDFTSLKEGLFASIESYLQKLQRSHQNLAESSVEEHALLGSLTRDELAKPDYNGGYEGSELYEAFVVWFLEKYKPSIQLREVLIEELEKFRFADDSFFSSCNGVLKTFTNFLSILIFFGLKIPEEKLNSYLRNYTKNFLTGKDPTSKKSLLESLIQDHLQMTPEIRDSYLKMLLQTIQSLLQAETDPTIPIKTLSLDEDERLKAIIRSILDLLDRSQEINVGNLRRRLQSYNAAEAAPVTTFLWNAVEVLTLNTSLHDLSLVRNYLTSMGASLGGSSIATNLQKRVIVLQARSMLQVAQTRLHTMDKGATSDEKTVHAYLAEIISTSSQSTMMIFIGRLKGCTTEFVDRAQKCIEELRKTLTPESASVEPEKLQQFVENFQKIISLFYEELKAVQKDVERNQLLHPTEKEQLASYVSHIFALDAMVQGMHRLLSQDTQRIIPLQKAIKLNSALIDITSTLNQDASLATIEAIIEKDLPTFQLFGENDAIFQDNDDLLEAIPAKVRSTQQMRKTLDTLLQLGEGQSLIQDFIHKKSLLLQSFFHNFWFSLFDEDMIRKKVLLERTVAQLPDPQKSQVLEALHAISRVSSNQELEVAVQGWNQLIPTLVEASQNQLTTAIADLHQNLQKFTPRLQEFIRSEEDYVESEKQRIRDVLSSCQKTIEEIQRWGETLQLYTKDVLLQTAVPWLIRNSKDQFVLPLFYMALDPTHHIYGVLHTILLNLVGPKPEQAS